jgi:hypothetical protein
VNDAPTPQPGQSSPLSSPEAGRLIARLGRALLAYGNGGRAPHALGAFIGAITVALCGNLLPGAALNPPGQFGLSGTALLTLLGAGGGAAIAGVFTFLLSSVGRGAVALGDNESFAAGMTIVRALAFTPFVGWRATVRIIRAQALRFVRGHMSEGEFADLIKRSETMLDEMNSPRQPSQAPIGGTEVEMLSSALGQIQPVDEGANNNIASNATVKIPR